MSPPSNGSCVVEQTTPYPWPFDGGLHPLQTCVVVVGAQRQFFDMSIGAEIANKQITRLCESLLALGGRVVRTIHQRPTRGRSAAARFVVPHHLSAYDMESETYGGGVGDTVFAAGIDAFFGSPLESYLRSLGIRYLLIAGFAAEIVVDSTLRSANDRGFECLVVSDAIAPVSIELGQYALASVTMSGGIFGALGTTTDVISALHSSSTPKRAFDTQEARNTSL